MARTIADPLVFSPFYREQHQAWIVLLTLWVVTFFGWLLQRGRRDTWRWEFAATRIPCAVLPPLRMLYLVLQLRGRHDYIPIICFALINSIPTGSVTYVALFCNKRTEGDDRMIARETFIATCAHVFTLISQFYIIYAFPTSPDEKRFIACASAGLDRAHRPACFLCLSCYPSFRGFDTTVRSHWHPVATHDAH